MKILMALGLSTALLVGCGRKRLGEKEMNFPTYEQIRGDRIYTNDIVLPQNSSNDMLPKTSRSSERIVSRYFGAFDFPADSVTYIVNGRQAKDQKSAEKEVKARPVKVERVSISEAGPDGKRFVEIDYSEVNANEKVAP